RNIRRRAGGSGSQLIVAGLGAGKGDAGDADGFGGANVLGGETGAGVAGGEAVAQDPVIRERDGGAGAAVIDLVDPCGRYAQRAGGDVGGGAGGSVSGVVAGIGAADRDATDGDGLVGADGFGGKAGADV